MPSAILFISPVEDALLSSSVAVLLKASNETGNLSGYSLTLGGLPVPMPSLDSGVYKVVLDTLRYPNGVQTLRADATHSVDGAVWHELSVEVSNTAESNTEYQLVSESFNDIRAWADTGLRTMELPASNRLRSWGRLWLLTENTPDAGDLASLTPADLEELAIAASKGQPVALNRGKAITANGTRPASKHLYRSNELLTYPGQDVYALLRLQPMEVLSTWATGYERGVKIRRSNAESEEGTEVWYALYRNMDGSGAAIFQFKVTGSLDAPTVTFEEFRSLDEFTPDAFDFCIADGKIHVLRESDDFIWIYDLDEDEGLVFLGLAEESRSPVLIEDCNGLPVVICVDDELEEDKTQAWQLIYPTFKPVWTMDDAATLCRCAVSQGVAVLGIAAGEKLYTSPSGTGAPSLANTFGDDITSLGIGPTLSLVGLANGEVWRPVSGIWKKLATHSTGVSALGAWVSDGETLRAISARSGSNQLLEEGLDGTWSAGAILNPPVEMTETVSLVTGLEGYERLISEASGEIGQPDYVAAVKEHRLLITTGDDGLFMTLQRSTESEAKGAFEVYEFTEVYVQ